MADKRAFDLDAGLAELAQTARRTAPRPSADLMARVLADAGAVSASAAREAPAARKRRWFDLRSMLGGMPGFAGGAVAAMALGLVLGLGIGYEFAAETSELPALAALDDFGLLAAEDAFFLEAVPF